MANDINDVLEKVFGVMLAMVVIGIVAFYGENRPLSRKYRTFLVTLSIATATQATIVLLARIFGDEAPTWQRSLMVASLGTLTIATILAVLATRTRARDTQRKKIRRKNRAEQE